MALKEALSTAVPLRERTETGEELYAKDGVRFVIKRDSDIRRPVCVTVLLEKQSFDDQIAASLLERFGV